MKYTLITKSGKVMQFNLETMAKLYQEIKGGVVFTQQILKTVDNYQDSDYTVVVD
jgi:hypothetical protein